MSDLCLDLSGLDLVRINGAAIAGAGRLLPDKAFRHGRARRISAASPRLPFTRSARGLSKRSMRILRAAACVAAPAGCSAAVHLVSPVICTRRATARPPVSRVFPCSIVLAESSCRFLPTVRGARRLPEVRRSLYCSLRCRLQMPRISPQPIRRQPKRHRRRQHRRLRPRPRRLFHRHRHRRLPRLQQRPLHRRAQAVEQATCRKSR